MSVRLTGFGWLHAQGDMYEVLKVALLYYRLRSYAMTIHPVSKVTPTDPCHTNVNCSKGNPTPPRSFNSALLPV